MDDRIERHESASSESTECGALRAYAAMLNTLEVTRIEPYLADDFVYESQSVFSALESKQTFLDYIQPKLETIRNTKSPVFAEMGSVAAYGRQRPCVVLAQGTRENLVGLVMAEMVGPLLKRLDVCVVPRPETASRSGEYPT